MPRPISVHSSQELLTHVRRARQLAEHYEVNNCDPRTYTYQSPEQRADWDNLLDQIK